MKMHQTLFLVIAGALGVTSAAQASEQAGQWYGTALGTYMVPDDDRNLKDGLRGFRLGAGRALSDHFNVELQGGYYDGVGDGGPDTTFFGATANGMFLWNREATLTPYILAGIGYLKTEPDGFSSQSRTQIQAGPGVLYDLGSENLSLRAEVLGRWADNSPSSSTDVLINVGLQYAFGSKNNSSSKRKPAVAAAAVVAAPADDDNDGVNNNADACPGTPAGRAVDARGCELDSDSDGVVDSKDQCPGSTAGSEVNAVGCLVALSLDGVNFALGSAELSSAGKQTLTSEAVSIKKRSAATLMIEGYTDSSGPDELNQRLSEQRANSVKAFLVGQGVDASRITAVGKGESDPVASNDTAEGMAANRRVVLRMTE